jgi:hypothetical protein
VLSKTDRENKEPNLDIPITATEAPMRENVLRDKEDPTLKSSITAKDAPRRAMP